MSSAPSSTRSVSEAIVLAGGLGTRLREVVQDVPKPMAPIDGRPFLEHQLDYWIAQGVRRFVLSVGFKRELITAHFGRRYRNCDVAYAEEETPLGTGGGLLLALHELKADGPFVVLNGDTFADADLAALSEAHHVHQATLTMTLFRVPHNERYQGVALDEEGRITSLREKQSTLVSGGVYLMERTLLDGGPWRVGDRISLEEDVFGHALAKGRRLFGHIASGSFLDIGVPADYQRAGQVFRTVAR